MSKLGLGLSHKLSQKQQLSLEQQLGFKLLQMTQQELEAYLLEESQTNPFLMVDMAGARTRTAGGIDFSVRSYDDMPDVIGNIPDESESVYRDLIEQIELSGWPQLLQEELLELLPWLDGHGFLPEVCPIEGWTEDEYHETVMQFQRLEPAGVGARSVEESLLLQSTAQGCDPLVDVLIQNHLEDIARGEMERVIKKTKASEDQVRSAVVELRGLSPYPLSFEAYNAVTYQSPDVVIEKRGDDYEVVGAVNTPLRPELDDEVYQNRHARDLDPEQKKQLVAQRRQAQTLLKYCDMREDTIVKVAKILVREQKAFLDHGPSALKPLSLKDIAAELSVHESTISRATSGKTMLTDRGLIPMRNFFVQKVSEEQGDDVVGTAVREQMRKMMVDEALHRREKPYSDQEISEVLSEQGMNIARRTVAKYRGILEIPSKSERKRAYKLEAFTKA